MYIRTAGDRVHTTVNESYAREKALRFSDF